ncbi:DNA mismatch repair protein [Tyrophagus putrescentiae]|nr:DNA mismatch repair protein [Tyrophagus putrescentiae]
MAEGDPVASVLQDLELLKQTNQQLENDYQNFNRAIAEAKRLQVSCTQNVAHQQDQLEQMRKKLGLANQDDVGALEQQIAEKCRRLSQVLNGLLVLNNETTRDDAAPAKRASTAPKKPASTNQKTNTVRPQFQVRTDAYQQRIDHYITQRQMEPKHRRILKLESTLILQNAVYSKRDQTLLDLLLKATFVGCVDENLMLLQHELDLVLVTIRPLNQELFYQSILVDFGNFDYIEFQKPLPIAELVAIYLRHHKPAVANVTEEANKIIQPMLEQHLMLKDYFSLKIDAEKATLEAIPWIVKGHMPVMTFLPSLLYQLATLVDWQDEVPCLHEISMQLAIFYARPPKRATTEQEHKAWASNVERLFFPLYKTLLIPSGELRTKGSFFTLTNITELYKFFERC